MVLYNSSVFKNIVFKFKNENHNYSIKNKKI